MELKFVLWFSGTRGRGGGEGRGRGYDNLYYPVHAIFARLLPKMIHKEIRELPLGGSNFMSLAKTLQVLHSSRTLMDQLPPGCTSLVSSLRCRQT